MQLPRVPHVDLHLEYMLFPPKLRWLYVSHTLRSMAMSMVTLYVPIFLFLRVDNVIGQLPLISNYLINSSADYYVTAGMLLIAVYFGLTRAFSMALLFPVLNYLRKVGLQYGLIIGNTALVLSYAALLLSHYNPAFLLLAALFNGVEMAAYWVSYFSIFSSFAKLEKLGEEVSGVLLIEKLVRIMSPLLGGIIASAFGFPALYVVGGVIMIMAINAALMLRPITFGKKIVWEEFSDWMKSGTNRRVALAFTGRQFDILALLAWPVFLFQIVSSIGIVGFVSSISGLLSLLVTYFAGLWLAKHRGRILFYVTGFVMSILWLLRLTVRTPLHGVAVDTVDRLFASLNSPIFEVLFIERSRLGKLVQFFVFREIILNISAMLYWLIVIIVALLGYAWWGVFVMGAIGALLTMSMPVYEKKKTVSPSDGLDG